MPDIKVSINSEVKPQGMNEAVALLKKLESQLGQTKAATEQTAKNTSLFGEAIKGIGLGAGQAALGFIKDFAAESVHAALENEKATKRLRAVAGELTDSLSAQADAFQESTNASGEMVMGLQEAALRWGAAPSQMQSVIQATLDYSAATGVDAPQALDKLLRGVEQGGRGLGSMGIQYESTGSKTKDLAKATQDLAQRFGGAAATNAATLTGQITSLGNAWGELQEEVGKWLLSSAESLGLIKMLQDAAKGLKDVLSGENKERTDSVELQNQINALMEERIVYVDQEKKLMEQAAEKNKQLSSQQLDLSKMQGLALKENNFNALGFIESEKAGIRGHIETLDEQIKKLEELKQAHNAAHIAAAGGALAGATKPRMGDDNTQASIEGARKREERERKAALDALVKENDDLADMLQRDEEGARQLAQKQLTASLDAAARVALERRKANFKELTEYDAELEKHETQMYDRQSSRQKAQLSQLVVATEQAYQPMKDASFELGMAVVNAIERGMSTGANSDGGMVDIGSIIKEIIPAAIAIVMSAYGLGAYAPLVAGGARILMNQFHTGGWVGDDAGSAREVPAMLLTGERVLSHAEVQRMGGPQQVDTAARGGGGTAMSFYVSTLDSRSFSEYMGDRGGAGLARAVAGGRGEAAQMIRRLQRGGQ